VFASGRSRTARPSAWIGLPLRSMVRHRDRECGETGRMRLLSREVLTPLRPAEPHASQISLFRSSGIDRRVENGRSVPTSRDIVPERLASGLLEVYHASKSRRSSPLFCRCKADQEEPSSSHGTDGRSILTRVLCFATLADTTNRFYDPPTPHTKRSACTMNPRVADLLQIAASIAGFLLIAGAFSDRYDLHTLAPAPQITTPSASSGASVRYASQRVRVRSGPSTNDAVAFTLAIGDPVWVSTSESSEWVRVYDPIGVVGNIPALGWVHTDLLVDTIVKGEPGAGRILQMLDVPSGLLTDTDFKADVQCDERRQACTVKGPDESTGAICRALAVNAALKVMDPAKGQVTSTSTCGQHEVRFRLHPRTLDWLVEHTLGEQVVYRKHRFFTKDAWKQRLTAFWRS
jgi:hypothetical protein